MPSAEPSRRQQRTKGRNNRVEKRAGEGTPRTRSQGGFSALVPIPNGRGRHRAAPFGLGPWDGARVASQQSPTLRPGQGYCTRRPLLAYGAEQRGDGRNGGAVRLFDPSCLVAA